MRYDPASRIMTLSFARHAEEHADMMLEAGRRLVARTNPASAWMPFFVAIGFGAMVGITMELYRRFILPAILDPSEIAPLGVVAVQALPIFLLLAALYVLALMRITKTRRKALIAKIEPEMFMDVDIYGKGVSATNGQFTIEVDWLALKNVIVDAGRIELETGGHILYIPERAFKNRAAFNEAAATIRNLWREAKKAERDRKMTAVERG